MMLGVELGIAAGDRKMGDLAAALARGVQRRWSEFGYGTLAEFRVGQGRRVDVCALNRDGHFVVVEIKTSVADFRGDGKWPDYLPFCDAYYFAVPADFPREILPPEHGLIVADAYDAAILRMAPERPMNAARRKAQIVRFALAASQRLFHAQGGPAPGAEWGI